MLEVYVGLVGLLCLGLSVYALKRPGVAWAMFALMYAIEQLLQSQFAFFTINSSITNIFFAVVLIAALVTNTSYKVFRQILQNSPQMIAIVFALLVIASTGWCLNSELAELHIVQSSPYMIFTIILAPLCLTDEDNLKYGIATFLILGSLVCVGLLFTSVDAVQKRWIVMQNTELLGNPLEVGSCGARVAIISFVFAVNLSNKWRLFLLAIACLGLAVSVKSGSRGQVLGAVIAIGFTVLIVSKGKIPSRIVLASIGLTVLLTSGYFFLSAFDMLDRFSISSFERNYKEGRVDPVIRVLEAYLEGGILTHLVGIGAESSYSIVGTYPHVVFGQVLAEQGLIGACLFCAIFTIAAVRCKRKIDSIDDSFMLSRGVYISLLGLLILDIVLAFKQGGTLGASLYFMPLSIGQACAFGALSSISKTHYPAIKLKIANYQVNRR